MLRDDEAQGQKGRIVSLRGVAVLALVALARTLGLTELSSDFDEAGEGVEVEYIVWRGQVYILRIHPVSAP